MSCPTGLPVGQCRGLQSDKQGQKAVGERKCQSHEPEGEGRVCVCGEEAPYLRN